MVIEPRGFVHVNTRTIGASPVETTEWCRWINGSLYGFTITRWVADGHVHVSVTCGARWRKWVPLSRCFESPVAHR